MAVDRDQLRVGPGRHLAFSTLMAELKIPGLHTLGLHTLGLHTLGRHTFGLSPFGTR